MRGKKAVRKRVWTTFVSVLLAVAAIMPIQLTAQAANIGNTAGVAGRVLPANRTGDNSDWIEIARNGDYSLIIRKDVLSSGWVNYATSGINNSYQVSNARNVVNNWFNQTLSGNARLRYFTVGNNALSEIGGFGATAYGISKPNGVAVRTGNDVAFLLSFAEAANFCSMQYATSTTNWVSSPSLARTNFGKLTALPTTPPQRDFWWLRSPGWNSNNASSVGTHSKAMASCVYASTSITSAGYCYIRPAMWVNSAVFEADYATINVIHRDANTNEILLEETFRVPTGSYGPYLPKVFPRYSQGFLAAGSDPASGTIALMEVKNITYRYYRAVS